MRGPCRIQLPCATIVDLHSDKSIDEGRTTKQHSLALLGKLSRNQCCRVHAFAATFFSTLTYGQTPIANKP